MTSNEISNDSMEIDPPKEVENDASDKNTAINAEAIPTATPANNDTNTNNKPTINEIHLNNDKLQLVHQAKEKNNLITENDYVFLEFCDGKKFFTQASSNPRNNKMPLRINKRSHSTSSLIGLPYGVVIEIQHFKFVPLPLGEDLFPDMSGFDVDGVEDGDEGGVSNGVDDLEQVQGEKILDNRNLIDNNRSQTMNHIAVNKLQNDASVTGSEIIQQLIQNSSTFTAKTNYAKLKYIKSKQKKHQLRFRVVQTATPIINEAMFAKDARKICNVREDTLAQILSYGNVYAGSSVLVFETCLGLITGACADRMGGYGNITSIYMTQQQPGYVDFMHRFNLTFAEWLTVQWIHCNDIFHNDASAQKEQDAEAKERSEITWPPPMQPHTRDYLENNLDKEGKYDFLLKRAKRFTRKLTRPTNAEIYSNLEKESVSSLIISISDFDPIPIFQHLIQFLKPSCTFCISCEYLEPLVDCFNYCKTESIAINLRLGDTWFREFIVEKGRTHPTMSTSQSGGYLLTGIKIFHDETTEETVEYEAKKMELLKEEQKRHKKKSRDGHKRHRKMLLQDRNHMDEDGMERDKKKLKGVDEMLHESTNEEVKGVGWSVQTSSPQGL